MAQTKPTSTQVVYDNSTAEAVFDNAKALLNYTALRAYTGTATTVRITSTGIAGFFTRDSDVVTADNGGTVIVDASGRRWKRVFDGAVMASWWGVSATSLDNTAAINSALAYSSSAKVRVDFPDGTIKHTGFNVPVGACFYGQGRDKTIFENTHASNPSISVPYNNDLVFRDLWQFGGFTLTATNYRAAGQFGLNFDTCRQGDVEDVLVKRHFAGVREEASWSNSFSKIRIEDCEYPWIVASGSSTPGTPNNRFAVEVDSCAYGFDIENNGNESTVFVGGSIEGCTNWALRINGNTNRAISFISFNFEGNGTATDDFDVVLGNSGDALSGAQNINLIGCRFASQAAGATRRAFSLVRGTGFNLSGCSFVNYLRVSDLAATFGTFHLEANKGVSTFALSTNANTTIPLDGTVVGTRASYCVIDTLGTVTVSQESSNNRILKSRRHTEANDRFGIAADGTIGWHAFNSASPDTTLGRLAANCVGVADDDVLRTGRGTTPSRPSPGTVGAGAMYYDTTLSKPVFSDGTVWKDATGTTV